MTSCATRKVLKSSDQKEQATQTNVFQKNDLKFEESKNVQVQTEVIANGETIIEKTTYTPVNPNITSTFTDDNGQKKELNNAIYSKEKTFAKTNQKENQKSTETSTGKATDNSSFEDKTKFKAKDNAKIKQTDRTSFSWWFLLLLIVPVAFYVYWNRKNTNY
jgi:hypothetical protein